MVSVTLQILMLGSFAALLVLVWRASKHPAWRTRAVIYGWAASIVWGFLWALLMPMWFRDVMDSRTIAATFPDGTIAVACLFGGWFWPMIVVGARGFWPPFYAFVRAEIAKQPEPSWMNGYKTQRTMMTLQQMEGFSPRPQITHAVFDFDGTLSWLRHGWPAIMAQLFREHIHLLPGESDDALREWLLNELLALNGKASIHQMIRCAELARERGGPTLDPEKLLLEYQGRLDTVIRERTERIVRGENSRDDFVVFGARHALESLQRRGVTLTIISGTAEPRVKEEAELLDLSRYFGGRVYGGTNDIAQSSKQALMGRFLREEKISGENLLCFGDGPVEIQLAKQAGGLAVGVASDEEDNGSGKVHPQKHAQLIAAGADVAIADYRDADALLGLVFGST